MRDKKTLEAVARILGLITATPNLRDQPQPGDRAGAFTHWFDGGAINAAAGYTLYEFTDGAWALLPQSFPHFFLQLPDGTHLSLSWEKGDLPASLIALPTPAQVCCPRCQHDNAPDSRFCSECGATLTQPAAAPVIPGLAGNSAPGGTLAEAQPAPAAATVSSPALETIPPTPAVAKKCPHCGTPNKPTARFCLTCGKPWPAAVTAPVSGTAEKICPNCQFPNNSTASHCQRCGAPLA